MLLPETKIALGIKDDGGDQGAAPGDGSVPPPPAPPAGEKHALPPTSMAAYAKGTPAQKAQAKARWAAQGFDVSGLN